MRPTAHVFTASPRPNSPLPGEKLLKGLQDKVFPEFEGGDQNALSKSGNVVFVGVADFPNESVQAQSFQDATDLSAIFLMHSHPVHQIEARPHYFSGVTSVIVIEEPLPLGMAFTER